MITGEADTREVPAISQYIAILMALTYPGVLLRAIWPSTFDWLTVAGLTIALVATAFSLRPLTINPMGRHLFYGGILVCSALFIAYLLVAFERSEYWFYLSICAAALFIAGAILLLTYVLGHSKTDRMTARHDIVSVLATLAGFVGGIIVAVLSVL